MGAIARTAVKARFICTVERESAGGVRDARARAQCGERERNRERGG